MDSIFQLSPLSVAKITSDANSFCSIFLTHLIAKSPRPEPILPPLDLLVYTASRDTLMQDGVRSTRYEMPNMRYRQPRGCSVLWRV